MVEKCLECNSPFEPSHIDQVACDLCESTQVQIRKPKPNTRAFEGDEVKKAIRLWWLRGKSLAQIEIMLHVKINHRGVSLQDLARKLCDGDYEYQKMGM